MHTITRTFKWMLSAWPILIPAILIATHLFWIENSGAAPESVNKLIFLILQVVGGLIVLYSIDLNIGVIQKSGLFAMLTAWFKAFPLIKRAVTLDVQNVRTKSLISPVKLRVGRETNTIEEKIQYLQQQIDWLKEDLSGEMKVIYKKIETLTEKTTQENIHTQTELRALEANVEKVSVGGVKLQVLGVLLVLHGSFAGYLV